MSADEANRSRAALTKAMQNLQRVQDTTHYEACCPHPKCQGTIKLAQDLPPGVYQCICHSCEVRWDGTTLTLESTGQARYLPPPAATNPIPTGEPHA